ncbi:MAG: LamG domain-containing protein [Ignavibacteria bacterium]|jgi:hypothetical protein
MKIFLFTLWCFIALTSQTFTQTNNDPFSVTWNLNNLDNIEGNQATIFGEPVVVKSGEYEKAIKFDGIDDGLLVKSNPLEGAESFTIEVIFKPDSSYPGNIEQRFVHIQDPANNNRRVLIELRLTEGNQWYLDTFIKSDTSSLTLVRETALHKVGEWHHAVLVYENGVMTHYVNGKKELSGKINYLPITNAFTSIGTRMDQRSWFKGVIALLKVTHKALSPEDFIGTKAMN